MTEPIIAAIAAMARNRVIGRDNKMPWHIPEEFKYFKRTTMGKPIIMGRKSFDALGGRPLPGRTNIIVSRQPDAVKGDVIAVSTVGEAIEKGREIAIRDGVDEVFITGGAQIYAMAMPVTQRLYLTVIDRDYEGDVLFPDFDLNDWREVSSTPVENDPPYALKVFDRL
ncbi:MAG: diacylglycerol kinase [Micavibrio sp.]|nr:diacylglycerol kinase [Micavibrio sp.]